MCSSDLTAPAAETKTGTESRNFNPGNIRYGDFAKSLGATGQDSRGYAIFPDETTGANAQHKLLSGDRYKDLPLKGIAAVWAPAGDGANDPVAYTKAIQSLTGFSDATMDKKYSELSSEQQALFRAAQKRIEQGAPAATTKTTTTTTPAATTTTGGVSGGARARQEGEVAGTKEFSSQLGKQHADMAVQIDKSGIGAPEAYNRATDILNIAQDKDMQDMFGILRQKGVAPFILKQLESGVQAGQLDRKSTRLNSSH